MDTRSDITTPIQKQNKNKGWIIAVAVVGALVLVAIIILVTLAFTIWNQSPSNLSAVSINSVTNLSGTSAASLINLSSVPPIGSLTSLSSIAPVFSSSRPIFSSSAPPVTSSLTPIQPQIIDRNSISTNWGNVFGFISIQGNARPGFIIDSISSTVTVDGVTYPAGPSPQGCFINSGQSFSCGWQYTQLQGRIPPGAIALFEITVTDNQRGTQVLQLQETAF